MGMSRRSRNKILSKLSAIQEEEEAHHEKEVERQTKTLIDIKPVISKFEASLLKL